MGVLGVSLGYRGFLSGESENMYKQYSSEIPEGDTRHKQIESMDKQKPIFDAISIGLVFPIIYYHIKVIFNI